MKKKLIRHLKQKGWPEEDIEKARHIIETRKRIDKSRSITHMSRTLYWMTFFVIVIGNFLISLCLIPVLLVLNKWGLDLIIIFLGLSIGLLFNLLITDIEHISRKHHLVIGIAIPVIAVINFFFIVYVANWLNRILKISMVRQSPYIIILLYVIAFMAPYAATEIKRRI